MYNQQELILEKTFPVILVICVYGILGICNTSEYVTYSSGTCNILEQYQYRGICGGSDIAYLSVNKGYETDFINFITLNISELITLQEK